MRTLTLTSYAHPGVQDGAHGELLLQALEVPTDAAGTVDAVSRNSAGIPAGRFTRFLDFSTVTAMRLAVGSGDVFKVLTLTRVEPHGTTTESIDVAQPAKLTIDATAHNNGGNPVTRYRHTVNLAATTKLEFS